MPAEPFVAACVQTSSARDIESNIPAVAVLVREARDAGARLILLPENVSMIEPEPQRLRAKARPEAEHPALAAFQDLARETEAWLLIGSLAITADDGKVANRSLLLDAAGHVVARYDKIHLFDVDLGDGEQYRESATIAPGDRAVTAALPWGRLGMSVCYDLRFPHLYRTLAKAGADFLAVPAAFTRTTGRAHWHVLLRARAIETGCYVFAPAQCGVHAEGRETFGHSLIIDPWGGILADGGDVVGAITATIDPQQVQDARRRIPSLTHDRSYAGPD
ncbi:MAG: carbon-nitrogen hydrolase family protein [Rhodospirillales bacterium]|nr:carbon-nitrogen hydrolase family protein [Rhodospirillales bacterium]